MRRARIVQPPSVTAAPPEVQRAPAAPRTRAPVARPARERGAAAALPVLREAAAAASSGGAAEAAIQALAAGGSAVDAVVAGFFAAAGFEPGVLLGSAAALVGHAGTGVRAFDARLLQPGRGAARPRGFVEGSAVPDAARVAVPRTVPMVMLLHAYGGRTGLSTLARHGVDAATSVGARARARVLRRVGAAGPLGLRTEGVVEAMLAAGNSVAGGVLTDADFDAALPADTEARVTGAAHAGSSIALLPWLEGTDGAADVDAGWRVDAIVAVDARGGMAVLSYAHQEVGVGLPGVELVAPLAAVPVRRGVTRVAPGVVLRAPAPIGLLRGGRELSLAFGLAGGWERGGRPLFQGPLDVAPLSTLAEGTAVETALSALMAAHGASRGVAAARSPRAARAVAMGAAGAVPTSEAGASP